MKKNSAFLGEFSFAIARFARHFPLNGKIFRFISFLMRWRPNPRKAPFKGGNGYMLQKETNNLHYIAGVHEFLLLKSIHSFLEDGATMIDIGANAGTSILWLHFEKPQKKVNYVAFEAMPENVKIIDENLALNPSVSCRVIGKALGPEVGEMKMSTVGAGDGSAAMIDLIDTGRAAKRKVVPVEVTTLDHYLEYNLTDKDVILIDVEGFAAEVLQGGSKFLEKNSPKIIIEIHGTQEAQGVELELSKFGYKRFEVMKAYGIHNFYQKQ